MIKIFFLFILQYLVKFYQKKCLLMTYLKVNYKLILTNTYNFTISIFLLKKHFIPQDILLHSLK